MARKIIGNQWDRENRNAINDNFKELYGSTGQALDAADEARKQAEKARNRANEAKAQGDYAKAQGDYAKAQGDYAKTVSDNVLQAPHLFHDEDTNKVYQYGFKVKNGFFVLTYEEVE